MPPKPLALRTLEHRRIPHEPFAFDHAVRDAAEVARLIGIDPRLVYKTLVIEHDPPRGKPYLVMVPSDSEVDLKILAAGLGAKRLRMASHRDAERHTGLKVGGISALALLNRGFPVLLDERALDHPEILVSAGQRGIDIRVAVTDLITLTGALTITTG